MRLRLELFLITTALLACEDGPDQIFTPNDGDPPAQNGYAPRPPWVQGGEASYEDQGGGDDSAGRARFCDQTTKDELVESMVQEPIIPDVSVGGVPFRTPDGKPVHADTLLGKREDGKFCDPDGIYLDGFTWGPTQEVIVLFNQETRLVEGIIAYQQYLGSLTGEYTAGDGSKVPVTIRPRERVNIAGRELDQYTSRREQADKDNAWLNQANVTKIYRMIRESFFDSAPIPEDYDCVASKACDLIYTAGSDTIPQTTVIVIRDSGVNIEFSPEGQISYVYLEPVRGAPFEKAGNIAFGASMTSNEMDFSFTSSEMPSCEINVDEQITFAQFKTRCIDAADTRTLSRVSYNVESARDAVQAGFVGLDLGFLRKTSTSTIFRDGEPPRDTDVLYSMTFTRTLEAPVSEFRPMTIGSAYKPKLEAAIRSMIVGSSTLTPAQHPLYAFQLRVPFLFDEPQRIGELLTTVGQKSWIPEVITEITTTYHNLSTAEKAMVDARVIDPLFIIQPFVDAVLDVFSHGESVGPTAFKRFRTTDDRRWVIGELSFFRGNVPFRLTAQYSLNYGAITAITVEQGFSEIDQIFHDLNQALNTTAVYYEIGQARAVGNPYGLGGTGVVVHGFDRQLDTLSVTLETRPGGAEATGSIDLIVPGDPVQDRNGYMRQIRGERFEFVPADVVRLPGKETSLVLYVESDGAIGRVDQLSYKGALELCPGLSVSYGDDVPEAVERWTHTVTPDAYQDCEIVFNYAQNGNILDSVSSLSNRVAITVIDQRAVTASIWR